MRGSDQLLPLLKQFFGFSSFRPLQEQIISDALSGRDVCAVLPTGGGKSLCFQMPALIRPGLTVVVSPLIALMKDQVDGLKSAGVAATFLNSSLEPGESAPRLRGLHNGEFRLLYVAPERLMLPGFLEDLKRWNVTLFAIDEAHCISEWGHDFRPEYRQLASLRNHFPGVPLMALTATATDRVRQDICTQLKLNNPACYVASFNRPNLSYRVAAKSGAYDQILQFMRERRKESGIVYCQARKTAESLAARLNADGIAAAAYHAGMENADRSRSQESFLRDEIRVVCATIAFGMGINKPNVRFVIHYDLPKNVEGYYQETGRAGRDGLPGECLLLFSPGDRVKYSRFIDEKPDPREREIARQQLDQIVHYAEASGCRRAYLLNYFGEKSASDNCGGCDNCLSPRETWDATVAAQKFLSCVYRIRERSGFGVGIQHVVEVLWGAETERIRKWNHQTLSTYGIGHEHSRAEWGFVGRELIRLGFLEQTAEQFSTVQLTSRGRAALKERSPIMLTRPVSAAQPARSRAGEIDCDEALFEQLRQLRKQLADERSLPPYIIFSDVSLRQMARSYPADEATFSRISGVGEKKLREFGALFLGRIAEFLQTNPRQMFAEDSFNTLPAAARGSLGDTVRETLRLFQQGRSIEQICAIRGLKESTIWGHLEEAAFGGQAVDLRPFLNEIGERKVADAFERFGFGNVTGVYESLNGQFGYGVLRVYRALQQQPGKRSGNAAHPAVSSAQVTR
ncbi:MAG TPA: DNA helicase RecQ [Verrucomicrobiae bacterium]|nr:DNA helicase RecQ [Verrucomicrobiae bacterium]